MFRADYLRAMPEAEIRRRLDSVSVDRVDSDAEYAHAKSLLERAGILIVRKLLGPEQLELSRGAVARVLDAIGRATPQSNYETDEILVQSAERVVSGFANLAGHAKCVVQVRRGADSGMIDVFNLDRLAGADRDGLRAPFASRWLTRLLGDEDDALEAANMNLYLNRGVTTTRGFDVDSFKRSSTGFVYLDDVVSLDQGPYCYVIGSHRDGVWRTANRQISKLAAAKTETPFVDLSSVVPLLAPRGALILSDQAGMHRGFPQAPDAERKVLVMRYLSATDRGKTRPSVDTNS